MPFINRTHELLALQERWAAKPQLALLWGRRRIGKSTLLQHFAEDKPAVFYQGIRGTETDQLVGLTNRILAYRSDPVLAAAPLANWRAAVAYLLGLAREAKANGHPLLVVLDEFPYLVGPNSELPSVLQGALEEVKQQALPLFLVLAGSQIKMFEETVLQGPLFSRRTWGEQMVPLSYRDAADFFPDWAPADKIRAWAILGGIPYYLEQFEPGRSLAWNIEHRLLAKGQVLYSEAELFVAEELGSASSTYLSIIAAIAGGATRQSEIAARAGVEVSTLGPYLAQLRRLHVIDHIRPYGAPDTARSGLWQVADGYIRFWFRFVRPNLTDLEARRTRIVYRDRVAPFLDHFVSKPAFEDACREHARAAIGSDRDFPPAADLGIWWGQVSDPREPASRRTTSGEVEIVGYAGSRLVLAGEAKWRDLVGTDALDQLKSTVNSVPGAGNETKLIIYGRDKFTDALVDRAKTGGVILRTTADLFEGVAR